LCDFGNMEILYCHINYLSFHRVISTLNRC
jgi:hypothetical protein